MRPEGPIELFAESSPALPRELFIEEIRLWACGPVPPTAVPLREVSLRTLVRPLAGRSGSVSPGTRGRTECLGLCKISWF